MDFPDWSETTIFLEFPTSSGLICSYVFGSFWTADTCRPPLWEKAAAATYGRCLLGFLFKISSNNLEHSVNFLILSGLIFNWNLEEKSSFKKK